MYETENEDPSLETLLVEAPEEDRDTPANPAGVKLPPAAGSPTVPVVLSCTCWTLQLGSEIEPVWPSAVAEAPVNVTLPKSASGSVW